MNSKFLISIIIVSMSIPSICSQDINNEFEALRYKNELNFQRPFRVLETTYKNLDGFQSFYPGTKIRLETVIRYYLCTSIYTNRRVNKLISMDLSEFRLKKINSEEEMTKEIVDLVGDMYFGSSDVENIPDN